MSKQLYLFRHAEAVEKRAHQTDKERELTSNGVTQSAYMGLTLAKGFFLPDVVFSSTANRAMQTTTFMANALKLEAQKIIFEDDLYDASSRTLFGFINNLDNSNNQVMIVGHNPTLTYLAEYFTKEVIGDLVPAGIVIIKFDVSSWAEVSQGNGNLFQYLHPDIAPK